MRRLTTDKPAEEMGNVELAYNNCFAKNGEAYYRDFDMEISARDFARKLNRAYADEKLPDDKEEFDDSIIDNLQYDPCMDAEGLIALFYRNLWAMAGLRERLKAYEDAEEQGLLLRLPCKVGDTVHFHDTKKVQDGQKKIEIDYVNSGFVDHIEIGELMIPQVTVCAQASWTTFDGSDFGRIIFTSREAAEKALAEMEGKQ